LCWLYSHGGVYIDIDTEILVPLDDIVKNIKNNLTIMQNDFRHNYYDDIISDKLNCKHKTLINSFIISNKGNPKIKKCIENIMKIEQSDLENNYPLILFVMQHTLKDDIEYQIFERSDNKLIPFNTGEMEMFDIDGNKIGNCKYKNYNDGVFN
jgi:mannosyltransferase OCH1-like enzyme